jgi:hypothetical protein
MLHDKKAPDAFGARSSLLADLNDLDMGVRTADASCSPRQLKRKMP